MSTDPSEPLAPATLTPAPALPAAAALPADAALAREQAYLLRARTELARMRAQTLALDGVGGDRIASEELARTLWIRAKSLEDDGRSALFFGRLDLERDDVAQQWYIGRRHITDDHGDPVVIDWRAPVSTAFYRASRTNPMGVSMRRRFGFDHGTITALEDEHLCDAAESDVRSEILAEEIERPRTGPMRDIVATIQPEQDELVRVDDTTTVCIQGAPGTGKTAVGLHRAAWLLYAYRAKLSRSGVLVIGPNRAFLDHIGAVLPALGEVEVRHTTIDDLVGGAAGVRVRGHDAVPVAVLKGDPRMAQVLSNAVWANVVRRPSEPLIVPRGAYKWRVPAYQVGETLDELVSRGVRYEAARMLLPQRLAHHVMVAMAAAGDYPDDRVQDAIAASAPVKRYVETIWPKLTPAGVLFALLTGGPALSEAAAEVLDPSEQALLTWDGAPRSAGTAKWSTADAVLLDELADLLTRTPSLGHVVLDEAQDLSPMQLRAVGRRCSTGAATVLGDIAQGTTVWATPSWAESLVHLGKPDAHVEELTRGFRVPADVLEYAARLLPAIAPGLTPPSSVRSARGTLVVRSCAGESAARVLAAVRDSVVTALNRPGSIGVIVADAVVSSVSKALTSAGIEHGVLGADHGDVEHRVDVVPASVAKGLEFDAIVVLEPSAIAAAEPDERTGLRRLYVVLTRAVSHVTIVHAQPLPALLADVPTMAG